MGRRAIHGSATAATVQPTDAPVDAIAHNPENDRGADEYKGPEIDEMAATYTEVGVLQPLGVVRYEIFLSHYPQYEKEIGAHDWVVIHGNRRLAAARKAGLPKVPIVVLDHLGREDRLAEARLIENIYHRRLSPIREAQGLKLLVDRHGGQRAAAKRLGKSQGYISQRLALLNLTVPLQDAVATGKLKVEDARRLGALKRDEQAAAWDQLQQSSAPVAESASGGQATQTAKATVSEPAEGTRAANGKARSSRPAAAAAGQAPRIRLDAGTIAELAAELVDKLDTIQLQELVALLNEQTTDTA